MHELRFSKAATRALKKITGETRTKIVKAALTLELEPRPVGAIKLEGPDDLYRLRVGDYRIVYSIHDDVLIVLILKIGHRKEIYRGLTGS